ncbi:MAG: ExeM/NucH family extracellular endonuclease, partial [Cytophagales bacterium]|nr:ExeM/NucH family extracellular endonuclease [Cytophagales bacterium]
MTKHSYNWQHFHKKLLWKFLFLGMLLLTTSNRLVGQTIITQWNFNSVPPDGNLTTGTTSPSIGSGTISLLGGTTASFASGTVNGGSTDPAATDNSAWNVTNFASQGTGNKQRGIEFAVSTVGYQNIQVSWDQRHSNAAARHVRLQYSTDGGATWNDFPTLFQGTAGDTWFNNRIANLSGVTALNNNANARFRIVAEFEPSTSAYQASNSSSTYNTTGTWRFDMLTVSGSPVGVPPQVSTTTPANGATSVSASTNIVINFDQSVNIAANAITVTGSLSGSTSYPATAANGVNTITITPSAAFVAGETVTVTLHANNIENGSGQKLDGDGNGTGGDNYVFSFTIAASVNTAPTIAFAPSTTDLLDGGAATIPSPFAVSGVASDPTDPAAVLGIDIVVADAETPAAGLTVTASSSNPAVVNNSNIIITGTGTTRNIRITPNGVGFSNITLTVSDGSLSASIIIDYAASAAAVQPANARFHTDASDLSAAVAIDNDFMLTANDEDQTIRLYHRNQSGLPVAKFDLTSSLALSGSSEVDIEGVARSGNHIYWIGSHSNNSSGALRPNRSRIIHTVLSGTGAGATITYQSHYANFRTDLFTWGDANGYNLTASGAAGKVPEDPDKGGLNIEGFTIAPDGTTAFIGFRAPQVPLPARNKALIAPVINFTTWANGGFVGAPTLGTPIELDLGGLGIRSIECNANGCLIIAGSSDGAGVFQLYRWSGNPADPPVRFANLLSSLNVGGSFEGIISMPSGAMTTWEGQTIQLLIDNGDNIWYGGSTISKDLPARNHQKSTSYRITLQGLKKIHELQGSGMSATPGVATVEGIVTGKFNFSATVAGFFLQEEDADADANPATSEGIFVISNAPVNVGDRVMVTGTVQENSSSPSFGMAVITGSPTVTVTATAQPLPATVNVTLPLPSNTFLERFEGMRVRFPQTLTVSDVRQLARLGEVVLSNGRLMQPTNIVAPGAAANAQQAANDLNRIILDDEKDGVYQLPFAYGINAANPVRNGYQITNLEGIMHFGFSNYRIRPTGAISFDNTPNPRQATPPSVGASATLKIAAANILNYFNTFSGCTNGVGGAATTCRGANNAAEFARQRDKIIAKLSAMNADVVGLMEVENDGYDAASAIQDLVNGLNAAMGAGTYTFIDVDANTSQLNACGTDAIKVAIIYKPASVTPIGTTAVLNNVYPFTTNTRPALTQAFRQNSNGGTFIVSVNHFKSKSGTGTGANADQGDGQGAFNADRVAAANALLAHLATDPTGTGINRIIIMGDLNSYAKEDPITTLKNAGYIDLIDEFDGDPAAVKGYSYVFSGQAGYLDHALATPAIRPFVTGAVEWHINSDEPEEFDYNTENLSGSTAKPANFYQPDMFRSSDHDPLLIGLNLQPEIAVLGNGIEIADGDLTPNAADHTDFGSVTLGNAQTHTFSIRNTGSARLNLTGTPIVTVTPTTHFTVQAQPAANHINPDGTDLTFVVKYQPLALGTHTAEISIANNDADENPYNFIIQGNATCPTITINPTSLPNGTVGSSYSQTLTQTGLTGTPTWTVSSGSLPAGLSLNSGTGAISGTPTAAGTYNFTIQVSGGGCSATQSYTVVINCPAIVNILPASLPNGTVSTLYTQSLTQSPLPGPVTWSGAGLPSWLSISSGGVLSGTPPSAGTFSFTVQVTGNGCTATKNYTLTVINPVPPPPILPPPSPLNM